MSHSILHVIPYIGRAQGGPVVSLSVLAGAQADAGHRVTVVCAPREADGPEMPFGPGVQVIRARPSGRGSFRWCPDLEQALRPTTPDILHSHGLWTDVHRRAAAWARRRRIPHVVAPCGMLDAGALRRSRWKKLPAWLLFQRAALRSAALLQAKSEHEARDIRSAGLRTPVALIPNPVAPPPAGAWSGERFRREYGLEDGRRILLYLGRIHPVKGVADLVRAWTSLPQFHSQWRLVIAGPDEAGHRAGIETLLRREGLERTVVFTGMLEDDRKWGAYGSADLFVMPSHFENFGQSVAESLMVGLPVTVSIATRWGKLADKGAGWSFDGHPGQLGHALSQAMATDRLRLKEKGASGRSQVENCGPAAVARQWDSVLEWSASAGPIPDCVQVSVSQGRSVVRRKMGGP